MTARSDVALAGLVIALACVIMPIYPQETPFAIYGPPFYMGPSGISTEDNAVDVKVTESNLCLFIRKHIFDFGGRKNDREISYYLHKGGPDNTAIQVTPNAFEYNEYIRSALFDQSIAIPAISPSSSGYPHWHFRWRLINATGQITYSDTLDIQYNYYMGYGISQNDRQHCLFWFRDTDQNYGTSVYYLDGQAHPAWNVVVPDSLYLTEPWASIIDLKVELIDSTHFAVCVLVDDVYIQKIYIYDINNLSQVSSYEFDYGREKFFSSRYNNASLISYLDNNIVKVSKLSISGPVHLLTLIDALITSGDYFLTATGDDSGFLLVYRTTEGLKLSKHDWSGNQLWSHTWTGVYLPNYAATNLIDVSPTGSFYLCLRISDRFLVAKVLADGTQNVPIVDEELPLPNNIRLKPAPNPFDHQVNVSIKQKDGAPLNIGIYNIKGELVRNWQNYRNNELIWDSTDNAGKSISPGIFLIRATDGRFSAVQKVLKIK